MPETMEIRFEREKHACYLGEDRLSSVGTILRKASMAFNPWQKDEVDAAARARMDRGKIIHETLEMFDNGTLGTSDAMCAPFIEALKAVKAHLGVDKWDAVEEWAASVEKRFWGIVDRGTKTASYDIKTGTARPSSYRLQVAGYCILRGTPQGAVIYLPEGRAFDPEKDIEPVTQADFDAFEMALRLAPRGNR